MTRRQLTHLPQDQDMDAATEYRLLEEYLPKLGAQKQPEIPLHNNSAELDARQRVMKRKISFGPRLADGAGAWDNFRSLAETTRKSGVGFYHYSQDRISGANQISQLSNIVEARAKGLHLEASRGTG